MPEESVAVVLVYGTDELRVKERAAQLAAEMGRGGDWGTEIIDAWQDNPEQACAAIDRVVEALLTPPFLGGEKFIWMKNVSFFADTETVKISGNAQVEQSCHKLADLLQKPPADGVRVLISAPGAKSERRGREETPSVLTRLEKLPHVRAEKFHLPAVSPFESAAPPLAEIRERFSRAGLRIHPEALELLCEMSSRDARQLGSEIEKLIAYCHGQPEVSRRDVLEIVSPTAEENFWSWCDAVIEFRTADALALLAALKFQQENPVGLMINLVNHARLALKVRLLMDSKLLSTQGPVGEGIELLTPVGERKSVPSAWRIKRIAGQVRSHALAVWEEFFSMVYECYAEFFESGRDHFTMLEELVLRLHILARSNAERRATSRAQTPTALTS